MEAASRRPKIKEEFNMWTPMEPWQVAQLEHLSQIDHETVERALNDLWAARPELLREVTISAVDRDQLTVLRAAQILSIAPEEVERALADFRRRALKRCCVVVTEGTVAKLADGGLPVWEVVRVYRRLGSIEKLQEAFTGVPLQTLHSALEYAAANAAEIDLQIQRYEDLLERKRTEYPFAR